MQYLCIPSIVVLKPTILNNISLGKEWKIINISKEISSPILELKRANCKMWIYFFLNFCSGLTLLRYLITCSKGWTFFMRKKKSCWKTLILVWMCVWMVLYVKSLITASRHVATACNYDPFSVVLSPLFVCACFKKCSNMVTI